MFDGLVDILKRVQSRHPALRKRIEEAEALGRWETAVGSQIAKHSRAIRVQDGVLWVEVDHPAWKSELHHRKRQILDLLNHGRKADESLLPELAPAQDTLTDILFLDPRKR